MSTAMKGLAELFEDYRSAELTANPEMPSGMTFTDFIHFVQSNHNDIGSWTEDDWVTAALACGVREERLCDAMEEVASWGVVDNYQWTGG